MLLDFQQLHCLEMILKDVSRPLMGALKLCSGGRANSPNVATIYARLFCAMNIRIRSVCMEVILQAVAGTMSTSVLALGGIHLGEARTSTYWSCPFLYAKTCLCCGRQPIHVQ